MPFRLFFMRIHMLKTTTGRFSIRGTILHSERGNQYINN